MRYLLRYGDESASATPAQMHHAGGALEDIPKHSSPIKKRWNFLKMKLSILFSAGNWAKLNQILTQAQNVLQEILASLQLMKEYRMSNKMRTLMIVIIAALVLAGLGVWGASAQEPDDTPIPPCGGQMMGRGMGMMHHYWQQGGRGMGMGWRWGNGDPENCPFYQEGTWHNPEECPFWQANQNVTPESGQ